MLTCRGRTNLLWFLHLLTSSDPLFNKLSPLYEGISNFSLRNTYFQVKFVLPASKFKLDTDLTYAQGNFNAQHFWKIWCQDRSFKKAIKQDIYTFLFYFLRLSCSHSSHSLHHPSLGLIKAPYFPVWNSCVIPSLGLSTSLLALR